MNESAPPPPPPTSVDGPRPPASTAATIVSKGTDDTRSIGNHTFAYRRAIRRPSVTSVMSLFFPPSTATTSYAVRKVSPMSVRKQTSTARSKMYQPHSFIASKPTLALNAMRSGTNTCRTREAG